MSFFGVQASNQHTDIDGLLLNSLSLDDRNDHHNTQIYTNQQSWNYDSDDQMDIDEEEEVTNEDKHYNAGSPIINNVGDSIEAYPETTVDAKDSDPQEEDSSFISNIFSPTMLGAKLAMHKARLLLMPPPPTPKLSSPIEDHIDHEYDTSEYKITRSDSEIRNRWGDRNISRYSPVSDISHFLAPQQQPNPRVDDYNKASLGGGNGFYANNMNLSYMLRKSFGLQNPVTIHHHHYYYNSSSDSIKLNETTRNEIAPKSQQQELEQYVPLHSDEQHREQKLILPVPWKPNITPLEKAPYVISSYLQIFINFTATLYSFYIISGVIASIKRDISYKLAQQSSNILSSIETCRRAYIENQCHPDTIVPLLEQKCAYFERCMNQDPFNGGGNVVKISAETIGVLVNSLIEPLGLKFFMFVGMFVITVFACNFSFGYIRAKSYYGWNNNANYNAGGNANGQRLGHPDDMIID